jgi:hypothetical protein
MNIQLNYVSSVGRLIEHADSFPGSKMMRIINLQRPLNALHQSKVAQTPRQKKYTIESRPSDRSTTATVSRGVIRRRLASR